MKVLMKEFVMIKATKSFFLILNFLLNTSVMSTGKRPKLVSPQKQIIVTGIAK